MIDAERFAALLDSYGAESTRWPPALRDEMQAYLDTHPKSKDLWLRAQSLDRLLDSYVPADVDLSERIFTAVALSPLERALRWLLPAQPGAWWRPAVAGSLPLLIGFVVGSSGIAPGFLSQPTTIDWELQEQVILAPAAEELWFE